MFERSDRKSTVTIRKALPEDADLLDAIALFQEAVTEVRRIRGEMQIARKVPLTVALGDEDVLAKLAGHARAINELAGASLTLLVDRPKTAATVVVRGVECAIDLEGIVDFEAELARLEKVLVKAEKDVAQLEKRLSNPKFVDRAPAHVVDEFKGKLSAAITTRDTLRASHARIQEALA